VLIGTPLHYLFDAAGGAALLAPFAPVNESAWEHYKLAFWPLLVLALALRPLAGARAPSYWFAEALGLVAAIAGMTLFYYVPRALFGSSLAISIGSFVAAVAVSRLVWAALASRPAAARREGWSLAIIAVLAAAFILFSFLPPRAWLWLDVKAGAFGLG
jgi:hypothetical protein